MAVRQPHELAGARVQELLLGDLVRQAPAAEVRRAGQPRVGHKHRRTVVADEPGVADRLESQIEYLVDLRAHQRRSPSV